MFSDILIGTVWLHLQSSIRVRNYGYNASINTCVDIPLLKRNLIGLNGVEIIEILLKISCLVRNSSPCEDKKRGYHAEKLQAANHLRVCPE